jgi:hypothetical protein
MPNFPISLGRAAVDILVGSESDRSPEDTRDSPSCAPHMLLEWDDLCIYMYMYDSMYILYLYIYMIINDYMYIIYIGIYNMIYIQNSGSMI